MKLQKLSKVVIYYNSKNTIRFDDNALLILATVFQLEATSQTTSMLF